MPAPLLAAASYFGLPRLLGGLADTAMASRSDTLSQRGTDPNTDALMNLLGLVPRRSGAEETARALQNLYTYHSMPQVQIPVPDIQGPSGPQVTREMPYGGDPAFLSPLDDYLTHGGREDDSGLSHSEIYRQDFDRGKSYGQTYNPATEVNFPSLPNPNRSGASGFAEGGLTDLVRMLYAERQR